MSNSRHRYRSIGCLAEEVCNLAFTLSAAPLYSPNHTN
jgi:hypothetical protein